MRAAPIVSHIWMPGSHLGRIRRCVNLLEEVRYWGWTLRFHKPTPVPVSCLYLVPVDGDVNSPLLCWHAIPVYCHAPQRDSCAHITVPNFCCWLLGITFWSLCFCDKHFINWSVSLPQFSSPLPFSTVLTKHHDKGTALNLGLTVPPKKMDAQRTSTWNLLCMWQRQPLS